MISKRFAKYNLVGVALACLALYFWFNPADSPAEWQRFVGRMHPALVHLPIGVLVFSFLLTVMKSIRWLKDGDNVLDAGLVVGSWFGLQAIAAGSWLALIGGYQAEILFRHKLAGIVATIVAAIILFVRSNATDEKPRTTVVYGLWIVVLGALVYGGDLGGRMTHGDGFASEFAPGFVRPLLGQQEAINARFLLTDPSTTTVFDGVVAPIFAQKCVACHGEERSRGSLRLHSSEAISGHKGDEPLIVAGEPDASLLIQRVSLPEGHEDQMPPQFGAKPISAADVELLKWWIEGGASFSLPIADAEIPTNIRTILDAYGLGEIKTGIFALDVMIPDSNLVNALRAQGASVQPLSADSPFLSVRCAEAVNCFGGSALQNLGPQVAWLDLRNSDVVDSQLSALAGLPHLVRLNLAQTQIDGSGLAATSNLVFLEYLNLYGSRANDAAIKHLESVKSLRALYLWQTSVTSAAREALQESIPQVKINSGATD